MRKDVVALGVVLAVGSLAYGSSRITTPSAARAVEGAGIAGAPDPAPHSPSIDAGPSKARRSLRRERAGSIASHVRDAAARYGVPESLVAAVISVESEFNPRAVSSRGALGLMQLMPTTAALLGVRDAFDPRENVDAGARHLRDLLDRFANDVSLALAAYNAGAQAVIRHGGVPPYPETRAFVARVLGRAGRVVMPTVAVAQASTPPRVRLARHAVDRARWDEGDAIVIQTVLTEDSAPRPSALPPPPPPFPPLPVWPRMTPEEVSASVPAPLVRSEAP